MTDTSATDLPTITDGPHEGYRPCVGIVLLNPRRLVFAGQRLDQSVEAWQMPQGGIDAGEDPLVAAWREMREEIGTDRADLVATSRGWRAYDLPPELAARSWGGRYKGQTQRWFAFRFTGEDGDVRLDQPDPEFAAWAWLRPDELIERIVPFKRPMYRSVFAEFADLLA